LNWNLRNWANPNRVRAGGIRERSGRVARPLASMDSKEEGAALLRTPDGRRDGNDLEDNGGVQTPLSAQSSLRPEDAAVLSAHIASVKLQAEESKFELSSQIRSLKKRLTEISKEKNHWKSVVTVIKPEMLEKEGLAKRELEEEEEELLETGDPEELLRDEKGPVMLAYNKAVESLKRGDIQNLMANCTTALKLLEVGFSESRAREIELESQVEELNAAFLLKKRREEETRNENEELREQILNLVEQRDKARSSYEESHHLHQEALRRLEEMNQNELVIEDSNRVTQELELKVAELEASLSEQLQQGNETEHLLEASKRTNKELEEKIAELETSLSEQQHQANELRQQLASTDELRDNVANLEAEIENVIKGNKARIAEMQKTHESEILKLREQLSTQEEQSKELAELKTNTKKLLAKLKKAKETHSEQVAKLEQERESLSAELANLSAKSQTLESRNEELQEEWRKLREDERLQAAANENMERLEREKSELQQKLAEARERCLSAEGEVDKVRSLLETVQSQPSPLEQQQQQLIAKLEEELRQKTVEEVPSTDKLDSGAVVDSHQSGHQSNNNNKEEEDSEALRQKNASLQNKLREVQQRCMEAEFELGNIRDTRQNLDTAQLHEIERLRRVEEKQNETILQLQEQEREVRVATSAAELFDGDANDVDFDGSNNGDVAALFHAGHRDDNVDFHRRNTDSESLKQTVEALQSQLRETESRVEFLEFELERERNATESPDVGGSQRVQDLEEAVRSLEARLRDAEEERARVESSLTTELRTKEQECAQLEEIVECMKVELSNMETLTKDPRMDHESVGVSGKDSDAAALFGNEKSALENVAVGKVRMLKAQSREAPAPADSLQFDVEEREPNSAATGAAAFFGDSFGEDDGKETALDGKKPVLSQQSEQNDVSSLFDDDDDPNSKDVLERHIATLEIERDDAIAELEKLREMHEAMREKVGRIQSGSSEVRAGLEENLARLHTKESQMDPAITPSSQTQQWYEDTPVKPDSEVKQEAESLIPAAANLFEESFATTGDVNVVEKLKRELEEASSQRAEAEDEVQMLQELESNLRNQVEDLTTKNTRLELELQKLQSSSEEFGSQLQQLEAERSKLCQELEHEVKEREKCLERSKEEFKAAEGEIKKLQDLEAALRTQLEDSETENTQLQDKLEEVKGGSGASNAQIKTLEDDVSSLQKMLYDKELELAQKEKEYQERCHRFQEERDQIEFACNEQLAKEKEAMEELTANLKIQAGEVDRLQGRIKDLAGKNEALESGRVESEHKLRRLEQAAATSKLELETKLAELEQAYNEAQRLLEESRAKLANDNGMDQLRNQLHLRDRTLEKLSGYVTKIVGMNLQLKHERDQAAQDAAALYSPDLAREFEESSIGLRTRTQALARPNGISLGSSSEGQKSLEQSELDTGGEVSFDELCSKLESKLSSVIDVRTGSLQQSSSSEKVPAVAKELEQQLLEELDSCSELADIALEAHRQEKQKHNEELEQAREQLAIDQLEVSSLELKMRASKYEAEIADLKKELEAAQHENDRLHASQNTAGVLTEDPEIDELRRSLSERDREVQELSAEAGRLQRLLDEQGQQTLDADGENLSPEVLRQKFRESQSEVDLLRSEYKKISSEKETLEKELALRRSLFGGSGAGVAKPDQSSPDTLSPPDFSPNDLPISSSPASSPTKAMEEKALSPNRRQFFASLPVSTRAALEMQGDAKQAEAPLVPGSPLVAPWSAKWFPDDDELNDLESSDEEDDTSKQDPRSEVSADPVPFREGFSPADSSLAPSTARSFGVGLQSPPSVAQESIAEEFQQSPSKAQQQEPKFMSKMFGIGRSRDLVEASMKDDNSDFEENDHLRQRQHQDTDNDNDNDNEMSDPFRAAQATQEKRSRTYSNMSQKSQRSSIYQPFEMQQRPTGIVAHSQDDSPKETQLNTPPDAPPLASPPHSGLMGSAEPQESIENFAATSPLHSGNAGPAAFNWDSQQDGEAIFQEKHEQEQQPDFEELLQEKNELLSQITELQDQIKSERELRLWREDQLCIGESDLQKALEENRELLARFEHAPKATPESFERPPPVQTGFPQPREEQQESEMRSSSPQKDHLHIEKELELCGTELLAAQNEISHLNHDLGLKDVEIQKLEVALKKLNEQLKTREEDYEYLTKNLALDIYARSPSSPSSILEGVSKPPMTPRRQALLDAVSREAKIISMKPPRIRRFVRWVYNFLLPHLLLVLTTFLIAVGTPPETMKEMMAMRTILIPT